MREWKTYQEGVTSFGDRFMPVQQLFHKFVADRRLDEVIEPLKKSSDIFDIIRPTENQHSKLLAWLFNPREGHGQGDAILKDFLHAAFIASEEHVLANKQFFDAWPPSRIARAGFHSICLLPEFCLDSGKRLDLLMVDFDNKILVVVENKHGARYSADQLEGYYSEVATTLRQRPVFNKFRTVHIAVDRNYRRRQDEDAPVSPLNRWAYVDYRWLERGARRAELQLKRGNQLASLVTAYCHAQTDYEPPELRVANDVLAELARDYSALVDAFASARKSTLGDLTPTDLTNDVWVYAHHHRAMVDRLIDMEGLAFLEPGLRRSLPNVPVRTDYGKQYVDLHPLSWQMLEQQEGARPLVAKVWNAACAADCSDQFGLALYYRPDECAPAHSAKLRTELERVFPELKKGRQDAFYRTLGHVKSVSEEHIAAKLRHLLEAANRAVLAAIA